MDLLDLRKEIDKIDDQLIPLLQHRMDISRQVAAYKAERGLPVFNAEREGQILDCVKENAVRTVTPSPLCFPQLWMLPVLFSIILWRAAAI